MLHLANLLAASTYCARLAAQGAADTLLTFGVRHWKGFRLKAVMLVFLVSGSTGAVAILGSVLGAAVNHVGLFIGALFGGSIGVWVAVRLSKTLRFIEANEVRPSILGGCIGFLFAAPLAAANAHTPIIPILSVGLVGL